MEKILKCKYRNCGREFIPSHPTQTYCCPRCRLMEYDAKIQERLIARPRPDESICWTCKKATGGCSWSDSIATVPVEGWTAEKHIRTEGGKTIVSYRVKECPLYEKGR